MSLKAAQIVVVAREFFFTLHTLGWIKVRMLGHAYLYKPLRKIKMSICDHQADCLLMFGLISDLVI